MDPIHFKHTVLYATESPMIMNFEREKIDVLMYAIKTKFDLFAMISLGKMLKQLQTDIIHSHGLRYDFVGAVISLFTGIPLVITRHVVVFDHLIPIWKKLVFLLFDIFSMLVAKYVIAISDDGKIKIQKSHFINTEKVKTIYCGINWLKYKKTNLSIKKLRDGLKIDNAGKVVGTVAQLTPYKNIQVIIQALPFIIQEIPNVLFLIVGEGPERHKLENIAKELSVDSYVKFLGYCSNAYEIMCLFDIFVLLSKREGLPLSILEAMYAGVPVIASDVGAVREIVRTGENGVLLHTDDPEAIASEIIDLLMDQKRLHLLSSNASKMVHNEFSIIKVVQQYTTLYKQLVHQH